jgi:hypothetical protein
MTADGQKCRLKNKAQADRKKIEPHRAKHSSAQLNKGVHKRCEKTDCRNDEKSAIHFKETYCKSRLPAWQSAL